MIQSIHLKNFQAHKDSKLEFHPGVNVIAGQSDRGKSSIIRAFRLVHENRPAGESYRSHFAGKQNTEVTITVSEGSAGRTRGPKDNYYQVNEEQFKAVGQKVPEEVSNLLDMRPVNFQYQMDRHFLLDLHPSKLAQYLNEEIGLDIIDRATSNIRKKILANSAEVKAAELSLGDVEADLEQYNDLEDLESKLASCEGLERIVKTKNKKVNDLGVLIVRVKQTRKKVRQFALKTDGAKIPYQSCLFLSKKLNTTKDKAERLGRLIRQITRNETILAENKRAVEAAEPFISACSRRASLLQEKRIKTNTLGSLIRVIKQSINKVEKDKRVMTDARERYESAIPDICPTCGQNWPEDK